MIDVKDILFDADISISGGDLDVDSSDQQHVHHIIYARPGQFTKDPTLGAAGQDAILATLHKPTEVQKIKINLELDNYRVNKVDVIGGLDTFVTRIDATRKK